ncbi:MAG: molybdopterin-dependent oxidoreductase [Desulfatirhabdiaceae bacterium]
MSNQTVFSVCGMCPVRCPIEVEVENGQCRFIHGNRQIAGIRGALCTRGAAGIPFVRDEERPQFPMLRIGERGEGKWRRISWEDAYGYAADHLKAACSIEGGKSLLWSDAGGPFSDLRQAFVRGLGSPNFFIEDALHAVNRNHAALSLFGFTDDRLVPDLKKARHVVLQARNLLDSVHVQQANDLLDSLENGCKLTVIDVRSTVTSGKADRFFMIRPGSDYALNLAIIHVLLKEKLVDPAFAKSWIADIDELDKLTQPVSPELAEKETGIRAADITALAHDLAKAAPHVIWHPGCDSSRYVDSFHFSRSIFIINSLLGSIGASGGLSLAMRPEAIGQVGLKRLSDLFPAVTEKRADGVGWKYPAFIGGPGLYHEAFRAIQTKDPYPIKACVTYQSDPLGELPDPAVVKSWLDRLDFLACISDAWSETAWQADLILPLSPYLERESILGQINGIHPSFLVRQRCTTPRFDTRSDWEIVSGLSKKLGVDTLAFDTIDAIWAWQLTDTGVRVRDFDRKGLVEFSGKLPHDGLPGDFRFTTESGKIEMVSTNWQRQGLSSLKTYTPKPRLPSGSFRLTIGGCGLQSGGRTINNPLLYSRMPENVLWMNRARAAELSIENGTIVTVSSGAFSGSIRIRLTEFIHHEAVFMVPGFGRTLPVESRAMGKGLAANRLMIGGLDIRDQDGGGLAFQEHVVTVAKAG